MSASAADTVVVYLEARGNAAKVIDQTSKAVDGLAKEAKSAVAETKKLDTELSGFEKSLPTVAGLFGVVAGAGAIGAFVKSAIDGASALGDLASNLGVSTTFIQEMGYAAQQSGMSQEQFNTALERFTRGVGEAASGNKQFLDTYKSLGISIKDTSGTLKTNEQLFREVADRIGTVGSKAEQSRILFDLFGRSGVKMVSIFEGGSASLDAFAKAAGDAGAVVDEELIYATKAVGDEFSKIASIIKAQSITAVAQFIPELMELASIMSGMINTTVYLAKGISDLAGSMSGAVTSTVHWIESFGPVKTSVGLTGDELVKFGQKAKEVDAQIARGTLAFPERQKALEAYKNELIATREATSGEVFGPAAPVVTAESDELKAERLKALNEQRFKEFELIDQRLQLESEALVADDINAAYRIANLEIERQTKMETLQKGSIEELKAKAKLNKEKLDLDKKLKDDEKKIEDEKVAGKKLAMDSLLSLQFSSSKALGQVGKTAAIAQATIATYEGAPKAYAALAGIPFIGPALGAAAAGAVIAAGLSNVANIAGVALATGLTEVPQGFENDTFRASLSTGERVVDSGTNEDLKGFLGNGGNRDVLVAILGELRNGGRTSFQIDGRELIAVIQDNLDSGRVLSA